MVISIVAASLLVTAAPAFALFTNGGFEANDFSGWTLEYGNVIGNTASPVWGVEPYGHVTPQIITAATVLPFQTFDVDPYNGTYMGMINDITGLYHATRLSQTAIVAAGDLTEILYINWGAMLVNPLPPNPVHLPIDQPYFSIEVQRNGLAVDYFSANATDAAQPLSGWTIAGSSGPGELLWYRAGQYSYDLSTEFVEGDQIGIRLVATDCGLGAHGGYAFLDGIGTIYTPPPPPVPEPSAIILLALGLAGLGFARKRAQK
jgi:hypothetical protein